MIARVTSHLTPLNILLGYIVFVFLLGGGARGDIASLALLRVGSILVLGYALVIITPEQWRANRTMVALAAAWIALVAAHLVPLPPAIWHALPGRDLAVAIDETVGLAGQWRPISLVPWRTLNSLLSLTVPLAAMMLALCLTRGDLRVTAYALVTLVFASALLSLLQVIGGSVANPFYLYRITNSDSAVGLFANRNHNAMFLAFGIAVLGAMVNLRPPPREIRRGWVLLVGALTLSLIPFVVITQSRAGLALVVLTLGAAFWLRARASHSAASRRGKSAVDPTFIAIAIGAGVLAGLTWLFTGGNALTRLMAGGSADDELRMRIWPRTLELAAEHFPVGSGIGTFVEVFEAGETSSTLGPSYVNHAHNDFLELALTGGVPAMALLLVTITWLTLKGLRGFSSGERADRTLRRLGLATLGLSAIGSLYDYPLRTPSLATLSILALVWIAGRARESSPDARPRQPVRRPAEMRDSAAKMAA